MRITREQAQICSIFSMSIGVSLMIITPYLVPGVAMVGVAVWVMTMSESVLLAKVENEMRNALEDFSRKKEREVEEVLYFLRDSSIAASPFESIDGAKRLCARVHSPAMVLSSDYQVVTANKHMHRVLGWKDGELSGIPAHTINVPIVMSKVGEYATRPEHALAKCMSTHYVYISKSGQKIPGIMHASKIGVEGFLVSFYPESESVISYSEIAELIN